MPFKLTKDQAAEKSRLTDEIVGAKAKIEQAMQAYNTSVAALRPPVEEVVTQLNNLLAEAREFCSGIAAKAQDDIDEKSDKWQDSDAGQAAMEWQQGWEGVELDDLDYQWPDELEIDIPDYDEALEDLEESVDET